MLSMLTTGLASLHLIVNVTRHRGPVVRLSHRIVHASCSSMAGYRRVECIIEHSYFQGQGNDVLCFSIQSCLPWKDASVVVGILTDEGIDVLSWQIPACIFLLCCHKCLYYQRLYLFFCVAVGYALIFCNCIYQLMPDNILIECLIWGQAG